MRNRRRALLFVAFFAYIITVRGVYLKTDDGRWVKVIEPDKQVDLAAQEASVSFFNNQGRIPAGNYVNFKISYFPPGSYQPKNITAAHDFAEPVAVEPGAFIRAGFDLDPKNVVLNGATLTVNHDERTLDRKELSWS